MNDTNYRNQLKNQIKEAYGKATYTHTAHHKLADRLEKKNRHVKNTQIVLTAFSACGFFALTVTNKIALAWLSGISSVLSLFLSIYTKEYKIQNEINQHRNAANALWDIRESYVSLLTDYEILENDDIRHQRDALRKKVSEVNNNYPATDSKSYRAAQKALKKDEEQTFREGEVDSILPNGIG